jgi:hypothetical protein
MKTGVVFASTGGPKIVRAIRSFRRAEPDLPIHIVLDVSSNTYRGNAPPLLWLESQPNVQVKQIENKFYINGCLNEGMRWMAELGYDYGCLFHDDVIFSPFANHREHISEWIDRLSTTKELQEASALTIGCIQAFVEGDWKRTPAQWDSLDLESEGVWEIYAPNGEIFRSLDKDSEFHPPSLSYYLLYCWFNHIRPWTRLGPTGQFVPVKVWESIGGFDTNGIFYDLQYPAECAVRGLAPNLFIPVVPHLHLHNQTIGYADPAIGPWSDTMGAFDRRYGDHRTFWDKHKEWLG